MLQEEIQTQWDLVKRNCLTSGECSSIHFEMVLNSRRGFSFLLSAVPLFQSVGGLRGRKRPRRVV